MRIRVASLNFSGINISPFQYYDGSASKTQLNKLFQSKLDSKYRQYFAESPCLAKLDKSFQKERYSLLYRSDVGVVRGRLLDQEQFEAVWDLVYESINTVIQNSTDPLNTEQHQQAEKLRAFDRIMYQTFLQHIFGQIDWMRIKQYDSGRYLRVLKQWHSKPYLQIQVKVRILVQYIITRDLDFMFIQQAEVEMISKSLPAGYICISNHESMIIAKKQFQQDSQSNEEFKTKYHKLLDFNNDSVYARWGQYLLISSHLSSKKTKVQQAQNMKQTLNQIMTEHPNLKVIIGIDANQFLTSVDLMNVFPLTQHNFTTRKRRTNMQLQFSKAGIIAQDVRDHIITNLELAGSRVETIKGQSIGSELLPNQGHPFDHFVVYSDLQDQEVKPRRRNSISINISGFETHYPLKKTNTVQTEETTQTQKQSSPVKTKTQKQTLSLFCYSNRQSNGQNKALLFNRSITNQYPIRRERKAFRPQFDIFRLKNNHRRLSFVEDSPLQTSIMHYSKSGFKLQKSPSIRRSRHLLSVSKESFQFVRKPSIKTQNK